MDMITTIILIVVLGLVLVVDYFYCVNRDADTSSEEGRHFSGFRNIFR